MVLEYLGGINLGDIQKHLADDCGEAKLDGSTSRFVASEVYLALEHIHSHGILYRDLKPENTVMSAENGHVKLVDFGLSQYESCDTNRTKGGRRAKKDQRYMVEGNVEYASPQVLDGERATRGDDWWSFGCLLYEMHTGSSPFYERGDIIVTHQRIARGEWHASGIDDDAVLDILGRLLQIESTRRLTGRAIREEAYFGSTNWEKILEREESSPLRRVVDTLTTSTSALEASGRPDTFVTGQTSSWQLEVTRKFFECRSRCETDEAVWADIIEPNFFVFCMPRTPYRAQAASTTVCKRTQRCAVSCLFELVEDMREASDSSKGSVPVVFEVVGGEFYGSESRAIAKLMIYVLHNKEQSVYAAAKCTFDSVSKKLTRVETCFDVNAFMHKLDPTGH